MFTLWGRFRDAQKLKRIYLDHAASVPLRPQVGKVMQPFLEGFFGNPSAIHEEGRLARVVIEEARNKVARVLGIKPAGVTFTSGGTEANNLAIIGYLTKIHLEGRAWSDMEVVSTKIEHPSISEALAQLSLLGVVVKIVKVDGEGFITTKALEVVLSPRTVLCTFAYANSEVGTVQSVHSLARVLRAYERKGEGQKIVLHIDGAQAPLWLPCELERLDADMLTFDASKCGGPKGSGILAVRKNIEVSPIFFGGGQEAGKRPGTENVAGIVGMAEALMLAQQSWRVRASAVAKIRDLAIKEITSVLPHAVLNGPAGEGRLANNINISLPGFDTEYAVVVLDTEGIAASTKSACAGAGGGESMVVKTLTGDAARSGSTLRLTLGEETTLSDVRLALATLQDFCTRMSRALTK